MNKQNNLPKYWVVKNTNNDDFKVVIDYLNTIMDMPFWVGTTYNYYGYDGNRSQKGTDGYNTIEYFMNNPTLLTLEEFKKAINMESNKKIIGYKLVKGTIENGEGTFYIKEGGYYVCRLKNYHSLEAKYVENNLDWFEPIYEEEIKTINMGSFNLTIKDKKVFHKNENITDFVRNMQDYKVLQNLGRYSAKIEEVIFSSTGCEHNTTKLSDWLKVYDMIK